MSFYLFLQKILFQKSPPEFKTESPLPNQKPQVSNSIPSPRNNRTQKAPLVSSTKPAPPTIGLNTRIIRQSRSTVISRDMKRLVQGFGGIVAVMHPLLRQGRQNLLWGHPMLGGKRLSLSRGLGVGNMSWNMFGVEMCFRWGLDVEIYDRIYFEKTFILGKIRRKWFWGLNFDKMSWDFWGLTFEPVLGMRPVSCARNWSFHGNPPPSSHAVLR